jgi:hypothetical protein
VLNPWLLVTQIKFTTPFNSAPEAFAGMSGRRYFVENVFEGLIGPGQ